MQLPPIIYGTAWKQEATKELVIQAVHAGFRAIDTACQKRHYHEAGVGEALKALAKEGIQRDALFIQTKFTPIGGQDIETVPYDPKADLSTQVKQSFEMSQKNLGTDYVNSLILHSPLGTYEDTIDVWEAMQQLHHDRKALQLGISNIYDLNTLKRLYEDAIIKPSYVQNRFYAESDYDKELRAWCLSKEITYQSFWTLTANPHLLASEEVMGLAKTYRKTPVQIMYRYISQIGATPLDGTTDPTHMKEDLESFDFSMSESEVDSITNILE